ncbi:MAG: hypothetical protein ACK4E0_17800 [Chitinophagaceae bacterium]
MDIYDLNNRGTTTAAHEYGHMLGYFVDKGIPTNRSAGFQEFDNDFHALRSGEPSEEGYIMYRNTYEGGSNAQLSKRQVHGAEFSRLNGGKGLRFPTHNGVNGSGKVMIVDPSKPKEYFAGQSTILKE